MELSVIVRKPTKQKHVNKLLVESLVSLFLISWLYSDVQTNFTCPVVSRIKQPLILSVETTLEPTGIPILNRYLFGQKTKRKHNGIK